MIEPYRESISVPCSMDFDEGQPVTLSIGYWSWTWLFLCQGWSARVAHWVWIIVAGIVIAGVFPTWTFWPRFGVWLLVDAVLPLRYRGKKEPRCRRCGKGEKQHARELEETRRSIRRKNVIDDLVGDGEHMGPITWR